MSTSSDAKSGTVLIVSGQQHHRSILASSAPGALTSFGTVERAARSVASKMSKMADTLARKHGKWGVDIPVKDIQDVLASLARDGQGKEDRMLLLRKLREQVGGLPTLVDPCQRLMAYTLPENALQTQLLAFKKIVVLVTRYLGLRHYFLPFKGLNEETNIKTAAKNMWKRKITPDKPDQEWAFFFELAATCISGGEIAKLVEESPEDRMGLVVLDEDTQGGVVERLRRAWADHEINDIPSLIAMRYIGGILELPTFWQEDNRNRHQEPAKRLFKKIGSFLEDAGFGSREPLGSILDSKGIDLLTHAALKGVHIWRTQIPADDLIHQCWAGECLKVVKLLLTTKAKDILPMASEQASQLAEYLQHHPSPLVLHEKGRPAHTAAEIQSAVGKQEVPMEWIEGPSVVLLTITDTIVSGNGRSSDFRAAYSNLHLQEGNSVVFESDAWTPPNSVDEDDFVLDLRDSVGNTLLHFNPRGLSVIVMNSAPVNGYFGGWAGPKERVRNSPHFKANSPNAIAIVNNSDNFQIFVNKMFLHTYQKRYTGEVASVQYLWRKGNPFFADSITMKVYQSVSQYLS